MKSPLACLVVAGLLLAAPAGAATPAPSDQPPSKAAQALRQCLAPGQEALAAREFDRAANIFAGCARSHPRQAQAYHWLGMAHFLAHQPQEAMAAFGRALELEPGLLPALAMQGKLYSFDKGKLQEAERMLARVVAERPDNEEARFDLARVYALEGRYEPAFVQFNLLFQGELRFALYHTELGKVLVSLGMADQARKEYLRALTLQPGFEPAIRALKELDQAPSAPAPAGR